jgi:hypothetical protein
VIGPSFLQPLVSHGFLLAIPDGLICRKSKATIYIKTVPAADEVSIEVFSQRLASFHDERLTYHTYMASCQTVSLHTVGVISDEVLAILRSERYQRLNVDLSSISQHAEKEHRRETRGMVNISSCLDFGTQFVCHIIDNTSSIFTIEGDSNDPQNDVETVQGNSLIDKEHIDDVFERQFSDCPSSTDLHFGSMLTIDDPSNVE